MESEKLTFDNVAELQKFLANELLTKDQAAKITGQSSVAFNQSVALGHVKPFYESDGKGPSKVRLYWKDEVEIYRDNKRQINKKKK